MHMATRQAVVEVFTSAAQMRSTILDGGCVPSDLERLYDRATGQLAIRDHIAPLTIDGGLGAPRPVRLTPNIWAFRSLFRCFAGSIADMPLPKGAFFSGSSLLAAVAIPCELATPEIVEVLTQRGQEHERLRQIVAMTVNRRLGGSKKGVSAIVLEFLGGADNVQIENLREEITSLMPVSALNGHDTEWDDVFLWTHNGFSSWARSDIDIFLAADSQEAGDRVARLIYKNIVHLEGEEVCCVVTPNTITFARSYPERHVQVVMLTMARVHHHLLFADLDCTAMALVEATPFTSARSRAALKFKVNTCPTSMLAIRRDTPKRLAKSIKRGFVPVFLEDPRAGDISAHMQILRNELKFKGKKLLDLLVIAEDDEDQDQVDMEVAVNYLVSTNTAYSAFQIPRMVNLTARGIEMFFRKLAELAAQRDDDGHLVTALISSVEDIPRCFPKLQRSRREIWTSYGMIEQ